MQGFHVGLPLPLGFLIIPCGISGSVCYLAGPRYNHLPAPYLGHR
jgi:hypothetical protein